MLKINKLYSEPSIFKPIDFDYGLNIILGEKSENNDKTNGVGKSLCIEFINYALLKDHERSRVSKIPKNQLPKDFHICLDFEIGNKNLIIKRNIFDEDHPALYLGGIKKPFSNKSDVLDYLTSLLFGSIANNESPSFRAVLGPLIRDEKSEFKSLIKCYDTDKTIPPDFLPHLFFLGINPSPYRNALGLSKELNAIKAAKSKLKENIEAISGKNILEAKAKLNNLKNQVGKIQSDVDNLENIEGCEIVKSEIIELEEEIEEKGARLEILKAELSKILLFKGDNYIDENEIADLYNQFKEGLGDLIKKEIEEVTVFKRKIDEFQRSLINERKSYVQNELDIIFEHLKVLNKKYKEKLSLLDQHGLLKNLKKTIAIHQRKFEEYSSLNSLLEAYTCQEQTRRDKSLERKNEIHLLDSFVVEAKHVVQEIEKLILDMHEFVYGNQHCSFVVDIKDNREIVKYDLRIYDDGSYSIDREKVFFYDYALLISNLTGSRHPGLLIHDNLFIVDKSTLIKNLDLIYSTLDLLADKQYIITLNRDMLSEGELLSLKLKIMNYEKASFTKEKRFLNMHYQETE